MSLKPPSQPRRHPNASPSLVFLPDELIAEVLSFLPVQSLIRLKCVSKSWKYLISEPSFVKLHLKRTTQDAVRKFVSYNMWSILSRNLSSTNCMVVTFTIFRLLENPPIIINLPKDPYYRLKEKDCFHIVGSCNGLLCLFGGTQYREDNGGYRKKWLRFWNPARRTILEKLDGDDGVGFPFNLTFGYANSTETHKVVYFIPKTTNVRVFSLDNNVWRDIQNSSVVHHHHHQYRKMSVVHLSSNVNWLAIHNYIYYTLNT